MDLIRFLSSADRTRLQVLPGDCGLAVDCRNIGPISESHSLCVSASRAVVAPILTDHFQGGVKLLVTGPWRAGCGGGGRYQMLFDGVPVPTVLVQDGVLRCQVPGKRRTGQDTVFHP